MYLHPDFPKLHHSKTLDLFSGIDTVKAINVKANLKEQQT